LTPTAALFGAGCFVIVIAALPETAAHLAGGMDTMLFAGVMGLSYVWYWSSLHTDRVTPTQVIVGLWLVGGLLIGRPEGVIVAGTMVGALWLHQWVRSRSLRLPGPLLALGLGSLALLAALVAWKVSTFGDWLPLPYYVKSHNGLYGSSTVAFPGVPDVRRFVLARLIPAALLAAAALGPIKRSERSRIALFLLPVGVALLTYARVIHEVAEGFRYEYPHLWPLVALAALGVAMRADAISTKVRLRSAAAIVGVVLLVGVTDTSVGPWSWVRHPLRAATGWTAPVDGGAHEAIALDLRATGVEGAMVATGAAGLIPFLSGWGALDVVGLNDPVLSGKSDITPAQAFEYIDKRRPDVFTSLYPPASPDSTGVHDEPLFAQPVGREALEGAYNNLFQYWDPERVAEMVYREMAYLRDHYEFGAAYRVTATRPWFSVAYVRRDAPQRERILAALKESARPDTTTDLTPFYVNDPRLLGRTAVESPIVHRNTPAVATPPTPQANGDSDSRTPHPR
jgi:hypothetical protein